MPVVNIVSCASCGKANPAENRFCNYCGKSLATPLPPQTGVACPACGANGMPGNKFCVGCGASLLGAVVRDPSNTLESPASQVLIVQPSPVAAAAQTSPAETATSLPVQLAASATAGPPKPEALPGAHAAIEKSPATAGSQLPGEESPPSRLVCTTCSAWITREQKFCLVCGTRLTHEVAPSPVPTAPSEVSQSAPGPAGTPLQNLSAKPLPLIAAILFVVGAAAWLGWQYFSGPDVTVITIPQRIHVATGGHTTLRATVSGSKDTDVSWSIQEGEEGGRLTILGVVVESGQARAVATYTAPQAGGTFHVIAASHANPRRTAKVEIIVAGADQPNLTSFL